MSRPTVKGIADRYERIITERDVVIAVLRADNDALREVLKVLEWVEGQSDGDFITQWRCQTCGNLKEDSHLSNCIIAKALAGADERGI